MAWSATVSTSKSEVGVRVTREGVAFGTLIGVLNSSPPAAGPGWASPPRWQSRASRFRGTAPIPDSGGRRCRRGLRRPVGSLRRALRDGRVAGSDAESVDDATVLPSVSATATAGAARIAPADAQGNGQYPRSAPWRYRPRSTGDCAPSVHSA